jgi:hypothetical protein
MRAGNLADVLGIPEKFGLRIGVRKHFDPTSPRN